MNNNNLFKFLPKRQILTKKLHPLDAFWSKAYVSEVWHFQGSIDIDKFVEALEETLNIFCFSLCLIKSRRDGSYIVSPKTIKECLPILEVKTLPSLSEKINSTELIPAIHKFEIQQFKVFPVLLLKLTLIGDKFILGFCGNHAYFDQTSIIYFFNYLSYTYSKTDGTPSIAEPEVIDSGAFVQKYSSKGLRKFSTIEELRSHSNLVCFKYQPVRLSYDNVIPFPCKNICLSFNKEKLQAIQEESKKGITKNHILSAVLLKIQAFINKTLVPQSLIRLQCACDIRPSLGLPVSTIGNLVISLTMDPISVEECRTLAVLELAELYKCTQEKPDISKYFNMVNWFNNCERLGEKVENYMFEDGDPSNPLLFFVTNWVSVNYTNINFNNCELIGVKPVFTFVKTRNVISFEIRKNKKFLTITKCIPENVIGEVAELGRKIGMYDTEVII